RSFLDVEAGEEAQFDDTPLLRIHLGQAPQNLIQCDDVLETVVRNQKLRIDVHFPRAFDAPPPSVVLARVVQQDPPHGNGGNGEEMRTVLPLNFLIADQAHIRLMDHCGGLQCVARTLSPHLSACNTTQLIIYERNELAGNILVARAELSQEPRNVATGLGHSPSSSSNHLTARNSSFIIVLSKKLALAS